MTNIRAHLSSQMYIYIMLLALGALMSYYYFSYVPDNEKKLDRHAIRLLHNKSNVILEKHKGYNNALNSAPRSYLASWYFEINPQEDLICIMQRNDTLWYSRDSTAWMVTLKDKLNKGKSKPNKAKSKQLKIYSITRSDVKKKSRTNSELVPEIQHNGLTIRQTEIGDVHFIYTLSDTILTVLPDENRTGVNISEKVNSNPEKVSVCFSVRGKGFTENLNSNAFFEDLFLVADQENAERKTIDTVPNGRIIDNSKLDLVDFKIPDSLKHTGNGFFSMRVAGQVYRVYYERIHLKRGLNVFAVGLLSQLEFERQSREVPVWFLIFCLISALTLVFLLPAFKLFFINSLERLSSLDAQLAVFSTVLWMFLATTVMLGYFILLTIEEPKSDRKLCSLANRMVSEAKREIDSVLNALKDPKLFTLKDEKMNRDTFNAKHEKIKFNEVFSLGLDSNAGKMKDLFYFNFSMGPKSKELKQISLDTFPIDVHHREYFKAIDQAIKNERAASYYHIEAITSFTTGSSEAAVSIYDSVSQMVRVITSQMPPLIKAILPAPFQYIITNQSGEIQLKSGGSGLGENFIEECNNDRTVSGLLRNGAEGYANFTYVTTDCRGYIMPLLNDWRIIVYYELQEPRNLQARIFALCIFSLLVIVAFTGIIHLALLADRRRSPILKCKTFFYQWLNPFNSEHNTWYRLFVCNLVIIAFQFIWLKMFNDFLLSILLTFICITVFYLASYHILQTGKRNEKSTSLVFLAIILLILVVFFLAGSDGYHLFFLIGFVSALALWWFNHKNLELPKSWLKFLPAYPAYIFSSLTLLSILPAWIFIAVHYRHESSVQNYFNLFMDVQATQVKQINDPADHGLVYDSTVSVKLDTLDTTSLDYRFYSMLRSVHVDNKKTPARHMGLIPYNDTFMLFQSDSSLQMTASESLVENHPKTIIRQRAIDTMHWTAETESYFFYLLAAATLVVVWFSCQAISRKIFFVDPGICFRYPTEPPKPDNLDGEFSNHKIDKHPLKAFPEKARKTLINKYKAKLGRMSGTEEPVDKRLPLDQMVYQLQQKAESLYEGVYKKCSEAEQLFLFDLAQDGVANLSDLYLIAGLSKKGLIRVHPQLEIVNRSFANYILSAVDQATLTKRKEKEYKEGQWHKLRPVVVIVIIAAFAFLSVASEDFMGRLTSLLAPVALVFPQIINIVTSIGKFSGSKST